MGFKSDLDEAVESWKKSNYIVKTLSIVSLCSSVTALASLSDGIVKWRGVFRETVILYQNWVSGPLQNMFSIFGIHLTKNLIDFLTVMLLINICWFRSMIVGTDWSDRAEKAGTLAAIAFNAIIFVVAPFYLSGSQQKVTANTLLGLTAMWCLVPLIGSNRQFLPRYLSYLGLIFIAVAVLTGINSGLTKEF